MPLDEQSPSKHNTFLGSYVSTSKKISHPTTTGFYDQVDPNGMKGTLQEEDTDEEVVDVSTAKRRKIEHHNKHSDGTALKVTSAAQSSSVHAGVRASRPTRPDSEDEESQTPSNIQEGEARMTQLEEALPPIKTDEEAIEAYEAQRAAENAEEFGNDNVEDTAEERMSNRSWKRGRSSIYVDAFHLALSTVLEEEAHLFDDAEKQVFAYFHTLSYEAQFLYVRLFLRKTSAWFRVAKLGYHHDVADIVGAVTELQAERPLPKGDSLAGKFPGEPEMPEEAMPLGKTFTFAECSNDQITTLNEASSLLLLDELKVLAKDAKVRGKNKTELLRNLRRTSGQQRGLNYLKRSETEGSATSGRSTPGLENEDETGAESEAEHVSDQSTTPTYDRNRDAHYTKKILEQTGRCIRLSSTPHKLFERVHLVFYRSTEWTEKSLTTLILAKIARRNFPEYIVSRSTNIFDSRAMLLEFESCLRLQFKVDNVLEFSGYATRQDLEDVKAIFESVYPRSKVLIKTEQGKEDRLYETGEGPYLRRFSPAWVYTRITHKVLGILARFKEHLREHNLICELLDQRLFHPSRRGAWYQRKALLEEHYMHTLTDSKGRSEEANKKHWKRVALQTCENGLQDRECHIKYHYDLQKRIKKLEKQLKIPKREQHDFGHVGLLKAYERYVEGIQIVRDDTIALRRKSSNPEVTPSFARERSQNTLTDTVATNNIDVTRRGAKTIWLDELDTNLPVSVESLTLSHYRKVLGYKGYHTEGGILRTLFGLLFYDVLFVYVPNVFQTAYQTCPLDLHTDAFYSTRISEINARINELSNGQAEQILRRVWDNHAQKETCIVGVRWDYELEDLLEIVHCWNGTALGTVMRVLAQEYAERGGGVPDLFLWKTHGDSQSQAFDQTTHDPNRSRTHLASEDPENSQGTGKVMFVEVKSENDRLSDTQRLWISVLLNAGVEVELCHVVAREVRRADGTIVTTSSASISKDES